MRSSLTIYSAETITGVAAMAISASRCGEPASRQVTKGGEGEVRAALVEQLAEQEQRRAGEAAAAEGDAVAVAHQGRGLGDRGALVALAPRLRRQAAARLHEVAGLDHRRALPDDRRQTTD